VRVADYKSNGLEGQAGFPKLHALPIICDSEQDRFAIFYGTAINVFSNVLQDVAYCDYTLAVGLDGSKDRSGYRRGGGFALDMVKSPEKTSGRVKAVLHVIDEAKYVNDAPGAHHLFG